MQMQFSICSRANGVRSAGHVTLCHAMVKKYTSTWNQSKSIEIDVILYTHFFLIDAGGNMIN